jgi:hypothetical protein
VAVVYYKNHSAEHMWLTSAFLNELTAICYVGMCTVIFAHFRVLFFQGGKVNVFDRYAPRTSISHFKPVDQFSETW